MKRPIYLLTFVSITILGLGIAQVSLSNQLSTAGVELAQVQQDVDNYKRENTILEEQVLEAASFTNIAEKAEKLGYVESKSTISLNAPLPLALRQ